MSGVKPQTEEDQMSSMHAIADFLDYQEKVLKRPQNTLRGYRKSLTLFSHVAPIDAYPGAVTADHLGAFVHQMSDQGLSASTIRVRIAGVSAFFTWAQRQGLAYGNPAKDVPLPKPPKLLPRAVDYQEVKARIEAVDGQDLTSLRDRAILELGFAIAARVSDLRAANWRDLNLEKQKIRLRGKGDHEDLVNFGDLARDALAAYLRARVDAWGLGEEALFLNDHGRRLSTIGKIVRARTGHAPHSFFRHTGAAEYLARGASIEEVRAHLRHQSIQTTARYIRSSDDRLRAAYVRHYPRAQRDDHIQVEIQRGVQTKVQKGMAT